MSLLYVILPSGLPGVTLRLTQNDDTKDTIPLTELAEALGHYRGPWTVPPGVYKVTAFTNSLPIAAWEKVTITEESTAFSDDVHVRETVDASSQETWDMIFTSIIPEVYASPNSEFTLGEVLYEIRQFLTQKEISGTTETVYKIDGIEVAATYELNNPTNPSSIGRST